MPIRITHRDTHREPDRDTHREPDRDTHREPDRDTPRETDREPDREPATPTLPFAKFPLEPFWVNDYEVLIEKRFETVIASELFRRFVDLSLYRAGDGGLLMRLDIRNYAVTWNGDYNVEGIDELFHVANFNDRDARGIRYLFSQAFTSLRDMTRALNSFHLTSFGTPIQRAFGMDRNPVQAMLKDPRMYSEFHFRVGHDGTLTNVYDTVPDSATPISIGSFAPEPSVEVVVPEGVENDPCVICYDIKNLNVTECCRQPICESCSKNIYMRNRCPMCRAEPLRVTEPDLDVFHFFRDNITVEVQTYPDFPDRILVVEVKDLKYKDEFLKSIFSNDCKVEFVQQLLFGRCTKIDLREFAEEIKKRLGMTRHPLSLYDRTEFDFFHKSPYNCERDLRCFRITPEGFVFIKNANEEGLPRGLACRIERF